MIGLFYIIAGLFFIFSVLALVFSEKHGGVITCGVVGIVVSCLWFLSLYLGPKWSRERIEDDAIKVGVGYFAIEKTKTIPVREKRVFKFKPHEEK